MQAKGNIEEEFFLNSMNVEKVFAFLDRTDYFFLYHIKKCMETSKLKDGVYLSELAEFMDFPMAELSVTVKKLQEKGYVHWNTDMEEERTYITLTNKAKDLMERQKRHMIDSYEKIVTNIRKEDMETTLLTLGRIRQLIEETRPQEDSDSQ
ncbi:MAG: MarR family winged helix-turn-helix transcriptional regulator [Lachnospiraceae bacterium]|nr:MarR family winged helix-turn-helix transcriptional regulator [Lachnospiraceae bacterium]